MELPIERQNNEEIGYDWGDISPLEERKVAFEGLDNQDLEMEGVSEKVDVYAIESPDYLPRSDMDFTFVERTGSLLGFFQRRKIEVTIPEGHCQGSEEQQKYFSKLYSKACKSNKAAQSELGVLYYYGSRGVMQSTKDALYWLKLSAMRDYIPAQVNIGVIYILMENYRQARHWFERAAHNGSEWGMYHLGVMHFLGELESGEQDYATAFSWFKQGAKKGLTICSNNVGFMYLQGLGVPKNNKKAIKWFRKLSTFCCYADFNLAMMYEEGIATSKNVKLAEQHIQLAKKDWWETSICPPVTAPQIEEREPLAILLHNF
jgi:tetratricopeptide (TPR) repeat protein